jgi:adenosylcobyric acid synthase
MNIIAAKTGWAPCGIIPWFADAWRLPAEDVMDIATRKGGPIKIAVPKLNRIANFDDLDPLSATPEVTVEIIQPGRPLPGDADLVLLPGSKSTISDLQHFRDQGWDIDLQAHVRRGGRVLGICGGYQMLGHDIHDPEGIEGPPCSVVGLGLLDVTTVMTPHKHLTEVSGTHSASQTPITGYEIHIGETTGPDTRRAWIALDGRAEGAASDDGRIQGCYLHGLFGADAFRAAYLSALGSPPSPQDYDASVETTLDALAAHLEQHMDVDALLALAAEV